MFKSFHTHLIGMTGSLQDISVLGFKCVLCCMLQVSVLFEDESPLVSLSAVEDSNMFSPRTFLFSALSIVLCVSEFSAPADKHSIMQPSLCFTQKPESYSMQVHKFRLF